VRFSYRRVPEVYQVFWAGMAAGEFINDAAFAAGSYRKQGSRWLAAVGGVRPRRGRNASVAENVATVLHILQHGIDLDRVRVPLAAEEYGRRLAQRGIPMAALLRAYLIGSTRFQHWCLRELAQQTADAAIASAAGLRIAETTAAYIDPGFRAARVHLRSREGALTTRS